jgi:hypothetical protein
MKMSMIEVLEKIWDWIDWSKEPINMLECQFWLKEEAPQSAIDAANEWGSLMSQLV